MITLKQLNIIATDQRGLTSDFTLPREQSEFMYITRKSGSLSGNTYHEGKNSGTSPKIFILLSGRILFSYRKVGTNEVFKQEIIAPISIEVAPYIVHSILALDDVTFLECNSLKNLLDDRVKEEV